MKIFYLLEEKKEAVRELLQGQMRVGRHLSRDIAGVALRVSQATFGGQIVCRNPDILWRFWICRVLAVPPFSTNNHAANLTKTIQIHLHIT
jgi:hypothetical protein